MSIDTPLTAADAPPRARPSNYPAWIARQFETRVKQPLGDHFGLKRFGVNRTTLAPGAKSALLHAHSLQDEFVYVLAGELVLVSESGETGIAAGQCIGFAAGGGAHQLVNRSNADAVVLEIGDRTLGDDVRYPVDDLMAHMGSDGQWVYTRKDGTPL